MKKDETIQNYLEAIYFISLDKNFVRAIDVVKYLNFSRPTVSVALKSLEESKYIEIKANSITLTNKGKKIALKMYERHQYIAELLISLGVDKKTAYEDSCLIEHDISEASFKALKSIKIKD